MPTAPMSRRAPQGHRGAHGPARRQDAFAGEDRCQFPYWALSAWRGRAAQVNQKQGADKGIDGRLYFHDDAETGMTKQIIFSVKSGHLKNEYVREMPGILTREKANLGVLITLENPTQPMKKEAASHGFYESPWGSRHPKVQILTVEELLMGKQPDMPSSGDLRTFKKAPKAKKVSDTREQTLAFGDD